MNYELAKQLKDAGLPQEDSAGYFVDIGGKTPTGFAKDYPDRVAYVPTLEELIEACGPDFYNLTYFDVSKSLWCAMSVRHRHPDLIENGSTPTEAVARLWLALNNK
jgi:hypothetical protein